MTKKNPLKPAKIPLAQPLAQLKVNFSVPAQPLAQLNFFLSKIGTLASCVQKLEYGGQQMHPQAQEESLRINFECKRVAQHLKFGHAFGYRDDLIFWARFCSRRRRESAK